MTNKTILNNGISEEDIKLLKTSGWCEEESQDCDWGRVEQIEKIILNNQTIVEHIMNCSNCGSIGWSNCKYFRQNLDKWKTTEQTNGLGVK